ncbi:MAG: peptidase S8 [Candidatus Thorarchaeota archaeon]|nr:MAG: peptidase S8 [Candidatus Thorarchaeota archaeon]
MVDEITAEVTPMSVGKMSLFKASGKINSENISEFMSDDITIKSIVKKLEDMGFRILYKGRLTIIVSGPKDLHEDVFKTTFRKKSRDVFEGVEKITKKMSFFEGPRGKNVFDAPHGLKDIVEGVVYPKPPIFFESPLPPSVNYHHLDVPADVEMVMNASRVHRVGTTGKGVKIAMPDTGFYRHPYFRRRGYRLNVVLSPDATNVNTDDYGHGTGEVANIFATAPDAKVVGIKMGASPTLAFNTAVDQSPDIITCSWGYDLRGKTTLPAEHANLEAAVASAVADGIVVCFSAGNGHIAFPAMHPDVIAVGGVHCDQNMNLQASNYASSFQSQIYSVNGSPRDVPDICGLVGLTPEGIYIMLPQQASSTIDVGKSNDNFPDGDETASNDGWAAFSGTSAASPQVAGVCSLLLQRCSRLTPRAIKRILRRTATDVTQGQTNTNAGGADVAAVGPDLATGTGLVNAARAHFLAAWRCRIIGPISIPVPIHQPIPQPIPVPGPIPIPGPIPDPIPRELEEQIEELEDMLLSEMDE